MEYGNLSIDNISNQNVDVSMADGVSLADEADPLDVYTIHRRTEERRGSCRRVLFKVLVF